MGLTVDKRIVNRIGDRAIATGQRIGGLLSSVGVEFCYMAGECLNSLEPEGIDLYYCPPPEDGRYREAGREFGWPGIVMRQPNNIDAMPTLEYAVERTGGWIVKARTNSIQVEYRGIVVNFRDTQADSIEFMLDWFDFDGEQVVARLYQGRTDTDAYYCDLVRLTPDYIVAQASGIYSYVHSQDGAIGPELAEMALVRAAELYRAGKLVYIEEAVQEILERHNRGREFDDRQN